MESFSLPSLLISSPSSLLGLLIISFASRHFSVLLASFAGLKRKKVCSVCSSSIAMHTAQAVTTNCCRFAKKTTREMLPSQRS
jgi:hypothetical protein